MKRFSAIFLGAWLVWGTWVGAQENPPLRLVQTIPLPQVQGRMDHLSMDVQGRRLFVAAQGNGAVEVIDLGTGQRIRSIGGLGKPQGVLYVPSLKRLFVTSGNDGTCKIFHGDSLELTDTVKLSLGADNLDYDKASHCLFVGHGGRQAGKNYGDFTIINPKNGQHHTDIKTDAHPDWFVLENPGPRIFVAVPEANQIAVIDRRKREVISKWPITGAQQNVALALDASHHRLFVATRRPPRLIVLDADSGKEIASLVLAGDADGMSFDPAHKRIYVSCGEGFIHVFQQQDANSYRPIAKIPTGFLARTSLFVPELNRYYVAVPHHQRQPAEIRVYDVQP